MNLPKARLTLVAFTLAAAVAAQEAKDAAFPVPPVTEQHKLLHGLAGNWKAAMTITMSPTGPSEQSTGTETVKIVGDRWAVSDFQGEFMGMPFTGHGVTGYDPVGKKYFGYWFDSMSDQAHRSEGTYDPATKAFTMMGEQDMMGQKVKMKEVHRLIDANTRELKMTHILPDGTEQSAMTIRYTRG